MILIDFESPPQAAEAHSIKMLIQAVRRRRFRKAAEIFGRQQKAAQRKAFKKANDGKVHKDRL